MSHSIVRMFANTQSNAVRASEEIGKCFDKFTLEISPFRLSHDDLNKLAEAKLILNNLSMRHSPIECEKFLTGQKTANNANA